MCRNRNKLGTALLGIGLSLSVGMACLAVEGDMKKFPLRPSFTKEVVHPHFIAEGVAVGDVNQDGKPDILSGTFWFEAPAWQAHEIQAPETLDYRTDYSNTFLNFATDVNQDGWVDLIRIDLPGEGAYWYENPRGKEEHWQEYLIDANACNESPMLVDLDEDGRMDLVFGRESTQEMIWFQPPEPGATNWNAVAISAPQSPGTYRYDHGLGFGDVNGDGRQDVLIRQGWWEAPADRKAVPWVFHATDLGEPCSQMYASDFDDDGTADIISTSAHAYGIWWHAQQKDGSFRRHLIDSSFSQAHGAALADLNGDGLPDLITGKRFYAHNGKDPGGEEPAVLYWFELQRDPANRPHWQPHLLDTHSGVGLQVIVADLNQDSKPDILSANKKGVHVFWQE